MLYGALSVSLKTYVEKWRDLVEEFSIALRHREEEMRKQLRVLSPGIERWMTELKMCL